MHPLISSHVTQTLITKNRIIRHIIGSRNPYKPSRTNVSFHFKHHRMKSYKRQRQQFQELYIYCWRDEDRRKSGKHRKLQRPPQMWKKVHRFPRKIFALPSQSQNKGCRSLGPKISVSLTRATVFSLSHHVKFSFCTFSWHAPECSVTYSAISCCQSMPPGRAPDFSSRVQSTQTNIMINFH